MKSLLFLLLAVGLHGANGSPVAAGMGLATTDSNGYVVNKNVGSDWNGNTGSGMTVNCTNCGGSGGSATSVSVIADSSGNSVTLLSISSSAASTAASIAAGVVVTNSILTNSAINGSKSIQTTNTDANLHQQVVNANGGANENLISVNGTALNTGQGTSAAGNLRVNIASDNAAQAMSITSWTASGTVSVSPTATGLFELESGGNADTQTSLLKDLTGTVKSLTGTVSTAANQTTAINAANANITWTTQVDTDIVAMSATLTTIKNAFVTLTGTSATSLNVRLQDGGGNLWNRILSAGNIAANTTTMPVAAISYGVSGTGTGTGIAITAFTDSLGNTSLAMGLNTYRGSLWPNNASGNWPIFSITSSGNLPATEIENGNGSAISNGHTGLTGASAIYGANINSTNQIMITAENGTDGLTSTSGSIDKIANAVVLTAAPGIIKVGLTTGNNGTALNGVSNGGTFGNQVGLGTISTIYGGIGSTSSDPICSYPAVTNNATNLRALEVSPLGVTNTYGASAAGIVVAASGTDFFTITGSGSHVVAITKIEVSGIASAIGASRLYMMKRATADSSGTSTSITPVSLDNLNIAATATLKAYTANPVTAAASAVEVWTQVFTSAATTTIAALPHVWQPGPTEQPIILRGTNDVLSLSEEGGSVLSGETVDVAIWFQEWP